MTPSARLQAFAAKLRAKPAALVFALIFAAHLGRYLIAVNVDYYPGGDGYYIYMLARSMAYDHDIDLTNDYAICGDPWSIGKDFGTGHPANPWFIGPATIWAPALAILKHVVPLPANAPPVMVNGCRGPVVFALGLLAPVFVLLTLYFGYRIARRFAGDGPALLGAIIVGFGSLLIVFGPLWWNYSHVWAAATLTLACLFYVKTTEQPTRVRYWVCTGAAIGWAALMRPHHMMWLIAPALLTCVEGWKAILARRSPHREALRGIAALAAFGAVFSIRLWSYDYMYGSPWPPVLRHVYLQPAHAHPLLLLFSGRAGLLTYTPMMWLAVWGFFGSLFWRRHHRVFLPLGIAFFVDFWICSSPLEWPGGATVGPRLLTSFCGMFLVWTSLTAKVVGDWASANVDRLKRFAAIGWVGLPLLLSWQLTNGDAPYDAPSIYGRGFRMLLDDVYAQIGNPATFPAPLVFRARYRTAARDFDRVAQYGLFYHDFEQGRLLGRDSIEFAHPAEDVLLLEGLEPVPAGQRIRPRHPGRMIYPLAWPFVSAVTVDIAGLPPRDGCRITVENALFFQHRRVRSRALACNVDTVRIRVPPGMFDSGINETRISSNCPLELSRFRFEDTSGSASDTMMPRLRNDPTVHP